MDSELSSGQEHNSGPPVELFDQHREMVRRAILKKVADPLIAEDLLQETFLRFHRSYESLRDKAALGGWLRSIAERLCLDHFRTLARERARLGETDDIEPHCDPESVQSDPPGRLVEQEAVST